MRNLLTICSAVLLGSLLTAGVVRAGPIDPRELNTVVQSWTVDMELTALNGMYGSDTSSVLIYWADIGPDGWTGNLAGTYLGEAVSVQYTGTYTATSPTTADISFTSTGALGGEVWSGSGTWQWDDPQVGGSFTGTQISVNIGGRAGVFSVGASVSKDLLKKELSAEVTAGVLDVPYLGAAVNFGGNFTLNQATGRDESSVFVDILWGLARVKRTVDRTNIFTVPEPPAPPQLPPAPWEPPYPYPLTPLGATGGFDQSNPNAHGYEYMYVGNVPEPATILLIGLGMAGLSLRRWHKDKTALG